MQRLIKINEIGTKRDRIRNWQRYSGRRSRVFESRHPDFLCSILPFFYQNPFIPGKTNGTLSIKLYLIVIVTVGIILKRDNAAHCIWDLTLGFFIFYLCVYPQCSIDICMSYPFLDALNIHALMNKYWNAGASESVECNVLGKLRNAFDQPCEYFCGKIRIIQRTVGMLENITIIIIAVLSVMTTSLLWFWSLALISEAFLMFSALSLSPVALRPSFFGRAIYYTGSSSCFFWIRWSVPWLPHTVWGRIPRMYPWGLTFVPLLCGWPAAFLCFS